MRRKPHLGLAEDVFWRCFTDLDSSRSVGMDASPIPPSEVEAWARVNRLDCVHLVEDLWRIVHQVDQHRLSQIREHQDQQYKAKTNANASSRN